MCRKPIWLPTWPRPGRRAWSIRSTRSNRDRMRKTLAWLRARADNVAVGLLTVMFISFVIQIVSRYVLNAPVDWTLELCLTTWLWVVFWEAAFLLDDRDHIRFDLLYVMAGRRLRRTLALLAALAIVVA